MFAMMMIPRFAFVMCAMLYLVVRLYMALIDILIRNYFIFRKKISINSRFLSITFTVTTFILWVVLMPFILVALCFFIVQIFT